MGRRTTVVAEVSRFGVFVLTLILEVLLSLAFAVMLSSVRSARRLPVALVRGIRQALRERQKRVLNALSDEVLNLRLRVSLRLLRRGEREIAKNNDGVVEV